MLWGQRRGLRSSICVEDDFTGRTLAFGRLHWLGRLYQRPQSESDRFLIQPIDEGCTMDFSREKIPI